MPRSRWPRALLQIHPQVHPTITALPGCRAQGGREIWLKLGICKESYFNLQITGASHSHLGTSPALADLSMAAISTAIITQVLPQHLAALSSGSVAYLEGKLLNILAVSTRV